MLTALLLALTALIVSNQSNVNTIDKEEYETDFHQTVLKNFKFVGDDMLIPSGELLGNAVRDEKYRWPGYPGGGTIPYIIDGSVSHLTALIEEAMDHYNNNTCVKFIKRTNETNYVTIFNGQGCYATIGYHSNTLVHPLSLGRGCHMLGTVIHELGHVIGFYHEQSRSDRDTYLNIFLENVTPGMQDQFVKLPPRMEIIFNTFDYDSIMIYGNYAFSKRYGQLKTMEAKNGHPLLDPYEKTQMTASDIERVKLLYKCA